MKNRKRFLRYKARLAKIEKRGFWYGGWQCPTCEETVFHYDRYDAACCISCDIWLDEACDDPDCPYCVGRPTTPSEALFLEEDRNTDKKEWRRRNYQHKNDGVLYHTRKRQQFSDWGTSK